MIVGNEVLLRQDLTANELRRYIRQVKQRVSQPVTYADVWEFWLRNPSLADEVDFITIHILPYWEDEPIGLDRREPDGTPSIEKHIIDIYKKVQARFPGKKIVIGETGWPSDGRMRSDARPGRVEQVRYFSTFRTIAEREKFDYNVVEAFDQYWKARQEGTVGATWGLLDAQRRDKFELGKPVSPSRTGACSSPCRLWSAACCCWASSACAARPGKAHRDLRRLRPARGDLLRAGDLDRPRRATSTSRTWWASPSGRCCSACSATPCCAASPTA